MSQKSGKICLFLSNWIGDVIMSTPSIRLLHEHFGEHSTLTVLGRPHLLQLLDGNPRIAERIPFDPRGKVSEYCQKSVIRRLRREQFDTAILFPNSFRSAAVAWCGGIDRRIGYGKQGRSFLLTHPIRTPREEIPLVDYFLNLTDAAITALDESEGPYDLTTRDRRQLELYVTPEEQTLGNRIWKNLGLRDPEKVIVLNVCSANSLPKSWPVGYAAELSRLITERLDMDVLLNCGPGEIATVREIARRSKSPRVFTMAEQPLNIHTGKICIRRARLTVSTDSGPLHMALGFGKPAIVLLGPTSETYIANPTVDMTVLSRHLECAPCHAKKRCPLKHHRCMLEITPEVVFEKIAEVLDRFELADPTHDERKRNADPRSAAET